MSTTLNEKIYRIIEDATAGLFEEDVPYVEARKKASAGIEILVLNSQVELLNEVWKTHLSNDKPLGDTFLVKISELNNKINNLKTKL